jgi:hypothetical protein
MSKDVNDFIVKAFYYVVPTLFIIVIAALIIWSVVRAYGGA